MFFTCLVYSYAVVLNDATAVREGLLKKSAHFAGRAPLFIQIVDNPERKGYYIIITL